MMINNELMKDYIRQIIEVATVGTIKIYLFNIATTYISLIIFLAIIGLIIA